MPIDDEPITAPVRAEAPSRPETRLLRRALLKLSGALGAATLLPGAASAAAATTPPRRFSFFTPDEGAFIEAAVARLIPADEAWGGAVEAGVQDYIDLQLAGAWGAGERLYRSGPWKAGTPSQGYQLPFTPAELFRKALTAIHRETGGRFPRMKPAEQDAYLKSLQTGKKDLGGVPSDLFFAQLWQMTVEGFFADPVYGGNKGMVSWRMIGFPGAYASYYDLVDRHGMALGRRPMSLGEDGAQHVMPDPNIPATLPAGKTREG